MRSRLWLLLLALLPACDGSNSAGGAGTGATTDLWGAHPPAELPPPSKAEIKAKAEEKARVRELVRQRLLVAEYALDRRAEYLVTDPSIVEPALDAAMGSYDFWKSSSEETRLFHLTNTAMGAYTSALRKPDGLKLLEKLVEKRFANPVIKEVKRIAPANDEDRALFDKVRDVVSKVTGAPLPPRSSPPEGGIASVEADYGWVPAPLVDYGRGGTRQEYNTENLDGYEASSKLVARLFLDLLARYPEAGELSLIMKVKGSANGETKRYLYHRNFVVTGITGMVIVDSPGLPSKDPLGKVSVLEDDFSPFLDGRQKFLGPPPQMELQGMKQTP